MECSQKCFSNMLCGTIKKLQKLVMIICAQFINNRKRWNRLLFVLFAGLLILIIQMLILMQYRSIVPTSPEVAVFGWESYRSRNASDYILPDKNTTIINNNLCPSSLAPPRILLIVCSNVDNYDLRLAIRNTWAFTARQRLNITVAFLFGLSLNNKINENIRDENDIFGDIIVEDFIDTYNNLTLKTIMLLKWAKQNCDKAEFIMKADDDAYINLHNLIPILDAIPRGESKNILLGNLRCGARPVLNPANKWYMPKYMYDKSVYPPYLSGVSYIMSMHTAMVLYDNAFTHPIVHLEDVFITGICAEATGITPTGHYLFEYNYPGRARCNFQDVTSVPQSHQLDSNLMYMIHAVLLNCDRPDNEVFNSFNNRKTDPNRRSAFNSYLTSYNLCS